MDGVTVLWWKYSVSLVSACKWLPTDRQSVSLAGLQTAGALMSKDSCHVCLNYLKCFQEDQQQTTLQVNNLAVTPLPYTEHKTQIHIPLDNPSYYNTNMSNPVQEFWVTVIIPPLHTCCDGTEASSSFQRCDLILTGNKFELISLIQTISLTLDFCIRVVSYPETLVLRKTGRNWNCGRLPPTTQTMVSCYIHVYPEPLNINQLFETVS